MGRCDEERIPLVAEVRGEAVDPGPPTVSPGLVHRFSLREAMGTPVAESDN
jgi:hypothetical protein